jgi:hypothetical protein
MPSSQLKRAERAIQTIRDQAGAGRQRTFAPLQGDGSSKSEITDRPRRAAARCVDLRVIALALASAYVVLIDGLE